MRPYIAGWIFLMALAFVTSWIPGHGISHRERIVGTLAIPTAAVALWLLGAFLLRWAIPA